MEKPPERYVVEPSDFMEGWFMVRHTGKRTQHFRTQAEAERYAMSPVYRDQVLRNQGLSQGTNQRRED